MDETTISISLSSIVRKKWERGSLNMSVTILLLIVRLLEECFGNNELLKE